MTPTFNGGAIFGPCPIFTHDDPPNAVQVNHYPGIRGVERLDLNVAATYTRVQGIMVGNTVEELGAALNNIRALKVSAFLAVLVDTDGTAWPDAIIESMRTGGRTEWAPGWGWCKNYELTIVHTGYVP